MAATLGRALGTPVVHDVPTFERRLAANAQRIPLSV
jgi:hypothetical protein